MEEEYAIIFDNGTFKSRVGFVDDGYDVPRYVIPSVVGRLREQHIKYGYKDSYAGQEAQAKRGILHIKNPIEHGIITNWDDMEKLWHHSFFNELRVAPEESKVFFTECAVSPKSNKEKIFQIMFESFNTPAVSVGCNAVSSLYANGLMSGIVLKIGNDITRSIPIIDGQVINDAITTCNFGGKDLTISLHKLLIQKGYRIGTSTSEFEFISDIKEKCCRITMDYDKRMKQNKKIYDERVYELPDGSVITVDEIGYTCTESIFQPSLISNESIGIHEAIYNSFMKCDIDKRKLLIGSVILSGGTSKLVGIDDRLQKELDLLSLSNQYKLSVRKSNINERDYSSFKGSDMICSNFRNQWITKQYYDEHGTSFIYRKVF